MIFCAAFFSGSLVAFIVLPSLFWLASTIVSMIGLFTGLFAVIRGSG